HSVGRYEGDTLVVETAGFNGKTFADATGAPQSDAMRTIERIRKSRPNELEIVITVHDPEYYARDWQARFAYNLRTDVRIEDYLCGEPHRDISSVEGVRRPSSWTCCSVRARARCEEGTVRCRSLLATTRSSR